MMSRGSQLYVGLPTGSPSVFTVFNAIGINGLGNKCGNYTAHQYSNNFRKLYSSSSIRFFLVGINWS